MHFCNSENVSIVAAVVFVCLAGYEVNGYCRVKECARQFQDTKAYENIPSTTSQRYCEIVAIYLKCMNDTLKYCHGDLRFHSSELVMRRHWKEFNCSRFERPNNDDGGSGANICYFNPPTTHRSIKVCSLFGDPHLIRFDGTMETCSEHGARPLVDNRYFLVQVTNRNVRGEPLTTAVSKITVLIRKHNCTRNLHYEASSDENYLPRGFVDGSTHQRAAGGTRNSIELLWQNDESVEIAMHFIHTSIRVRRQGSFLSVTIKSPINVLETGIVEGNEMCWTGCRKLSRIRIDDALRWPQEFSKCFARRIHVPLKVAQDRCRKIGTTDHFFDACVFDFLLTGDDSLVSLSHLSQIDFHRVAPHHLLNRLIRNRTTIDDQEQNDESPLFQHCLSSSSFSAFFPVFSLIFFPILAVFIDFFPFF